MTDEVISGAVIPPLEMKPGFVPQVLPGVVAPVVPAVVPPVVPVVPPVLQVVPDVAPESSLNSSAALDEITDPVLKSMASVMRSVAKGVDLDRVFAKALQTGDAQFLDVAYLREKAGASAEDLILIATGIVEAVQAKASAAQNAIHTLAGGQANWNACTAAFNKDAPAELRLTINQMINSGIEAHINAGAKMVVDFAKKGGFVPTPAGLLQVNDTAVSNAQALTKAEFQSALQALDPNDKQYTANREGLYARRSLGRQLGK